MDEPSDDRSNSQELFEWILERPPKKFRDKCLCGIDELCARAVEVGSTTEEGRELLARAGKLGELMAFDRRSPVALPSNHQNYQNSIAA